MKSVFKKENSMVVWYVWRNFLYILLLISGSIQAKVTHVIEDRTVLGTKQPLVVKFAAAWCTTCQQIAEPFEAVSDEVEFQHVIFAHVDIDRNEEVCKQHGVIGVPTFAYLDNGSKKGQIIGAKDLSLFKDHLRESIRSHFNMPSGETRVLAALPQGEELKEQQAINLANERNVLTWVWNSIVHIVDDVTNVFKRIFA
jgi:thiol-disulfide isomerase/thioredoxin